MSRVTDEAYELVERGHLDEDSFRDFMFTYPAEFWTAANPAFFEGTAVEGEVAKLIAAKS
ncbi:MAG: hypothetical protein VCB99_06270 [Myxococcota bacterium]